MEDFRVLKNFNLEETYNGMGIWKYKYKIKNKYIIIFLICIFSLISLNIKSFGAITQDSDGVYQINTKDDLKEFASIVNGGETSANAILTADIVFNSDEMIEAIKQKGRAVLERTTAETWTPIGNESNQYKGIFNGNEKTISGLYLNDINQHDIGLFGYIGSGGYIENVGVKSSCFSGGCFVGGLIGWCDGDISIENCYSENCIVNGLFNIGCVIGCCYEGINITNCYSLDSSISGINYVGGLIGECYGVNISINDCHSLNCAINGNIYIGSLIGKDFGSLINDCSSMNCELNGNRFVKDLIGGNFVWGKDELL